MVDGKTEEWMGFACKKCGAPLAVQRSKGASKSGEKAARGWRVTCTGCGATEYYESGTPMIRIRRYARPDERRTLASTRTDTRAPVVVAAG